MTRVWTYQQAYYLSLATRRAQEELRKARQLAGLPRGGVTFSVRELPAGAGTLTWAPYANANGRRLLRVVAAVTWRGDMHPPTTVRVIALVTESGKAEAAERAAPLTVVAADRTAPRRLFSKTR